MPARFPEGQILRGELRVARLVGEGSMGAIYEVKDLVMRRRRALKVMHPELVGSERKVKRFLREAGVAGRIDSPRIVRSYDAGMLEDGSPYVLMELLRGRTLEQELDRGPIDGALAAFIGVQICEGLCAAHAAGVVHRDLKPANIYLADDDDGTWSVKLLDFGISKILADHAFAVKITLDGSIIGTPHYMAPEQVSGRPDVDARADLYAVGVLLYEAVGGQPAFEAASFGALAVKIKEGKPLPLAALAPEVDPGLREVIERAMHHDRDARPATAAELRTALLPFARWRPLSERPSPEPGGPG